MPSNWKDRYRIVNDPKPKKTGSRQVMKEVQCPKCRCKWLVRKFTKWATCNCGNEFIVDESTISE